MVDLVAAYESEVGKALGPQQVEALAQLFLAASEMADGRVAEAQARLPKFVNVLGVFSRVRDIKKDLDAAKSKEKEQRYLEWARQAEAADASGELAAAVALYERLARQEDYADRGAASARAVALKDVLAHRMRGESLRRRVEELLGKEDFFGARREVDLGLAEGAVDPQTAQEMRSAAAAGIESKYPLMVTQVETKPSAATTWDSVSAGIAPFALDRTRIIAGGAPEGHTLVLSGERLVVLDTKQLRPTLVATLPPTAAVAERRGFALADSAEGRDELLIVNFEADRLLAFVHRRSRLELDNVIALEGAMVQTRQKATRWFAPCATEGHLVVCQSAPGEASGSRLYSVSTRDGKRVHDEEFGYVLTAIRRVHGTSDLLCVHRHPEPSKHRRPGYFSFAFVDPRLKIGTRFLVQPEDLDGHVPESARWLRIGPLTGRVFSLQRCYDVYSGQLRNRPNAFLAFKSDGSMVYAAADCALLTQNEGEIEPVGEVIEHNGVEYLVMAARAGGAQSLVILGPDFRMVARHPLPAGEALVAVVRGAEPGSIVLVSVVQATGAVRLAKDSL